MARPEDIQLEILESTYTEDLNGNRKFIIKIKFSTGRTSEREWFNYYVQKSPTAYLQLETSDGIKTSISQRDISIKWSKVVRGFVVYPVNEFSFEVTGKENLPNNIMKGTIYMTADRNPVSNTISIQKTLQSQIPESGRNKKGDSVFSSFEPTTTLGGVITNIADTIIPSVPEAQATGIYSPNTDTGGFYYDPPEKEDEIITTPTTPTTLPPFAGTITNVLSKTAPLLPRLLISSITKNSAIINWNSGGDGGSQITNWHYLLKNKDNNQTIKEKNFNAQEVGTLEMNLISGTNYKAYIIATNAFGNSDESGISFKTLGSVPIVETPIPEVTPEAIPEVTPEPTPEPIPEVTIPVEKEYDVTVLRINEFGGVYSELFFGIKGNKLLELESEFLVILSDKPRPTDDEVRDFYNFVDTSINDNMVSQSIGAFTLKDGKVTGKIIYIAEGSPENPIFNSYYYNKPVTSIVQIKDQAGSTIKLKTNNLNFTATERDETITINEGVGDVNAVKIEFLVWKSLTEPIPFTLKKDDEIVAQEIGLKPCPIGQHRNFNNKCVADDQPSVGGKPTILALLGGVTALIGTLALLGSKRR